MVDPQPGDASDLAPPPRPGISGRRVVGLGACAFVGMVALSLLAAVFLPAFTRARTLAKRSECFTNLRECAMAAVRFADDFRVFPHLGQADRLDGGYASPDTSRVWRGLVADGYLARPEALLCPSRPRIRGGKLELAAQQRWIAGQEPDLEPPPLRHARVISYGYVRRRLSLNVPSQTLLAADKAVFARRSGRIEGNHTEGWAAARVDGSISWLGVSDTPYPGATLAKTSDPERDGYLSVKDQDDPSMFE